MAKTPRLKPDPASNPRSRAARHLASSLCTDTSTPKSLSSLPRASDATLKAVANGGITKKRPQRKRQTRQQRLRQEKVFARAEDVVGKLEKRVLVGVRRERVGRERRRGWGEVNATATATAAAAGGGEISGKVGKGTKGDEEGEGMDVEDRWEDEEVADGVMHGDGNGVVEAQRGDRDGGGLSVVSDDMIPDPKERLDGMEDEEDNIT